jgi:hypothetical protein
MAVSSFFPAALPEELCTSLQKRIDTAASALKAAAGLLVRVSGTEAQVLIASATPANPYDRGLSWDIKRGLFCMEVLKRGALLTVRDARLGRGGRTVPISPTGWSPT